MNKPNIVLVTGPAGDAQGWGDMHVTEAGKREYAA